MLSILVNTDAVQVTLQFICLFDKAFQGCVTVLSLPWFRILPGQYKTCPFFLLFFACVVVCPFFCLLPWRNARKQPMLSHKARDGKVFV